MSNASPDEPSNTAFDLFDRWMTNREAPKPEETPAAPAADFVIPDTKASREAARARLAEAARLEAEGLIDMDAVHAEPAAPVIPPVAPVAVEAPLTPISLVAPLAPLPEAAPAVVEPAVSVTPPVAIDPPVVEPVVLDPAPVAPVAVEPPVVEPVALEPLVVEPLVVEPVMVEPLAVAPVIVEPVAPAPEPVVVAEPAPLPEFELPAYRPPFTERAAEPAPAAVEPVELPVTEPLATKRPVADWPVAEFPVVEAPVAPAGGKRRAAVAPDSPPVLATPVEGRRRRAVPADEVPVEAPTLAVTPAVEPLVVVPVVETPVVETPVVETPVIETPVAATPVAETPATDASRGSSWAEALAKLVEQEPTPEPEPDWVTTLVSEEPATVSLAPVHDEGWDPLTAPLSAEELEAEEPREGMNLRLIVSVLMVVAILGVGAAGYFLFRGEHWALKPTASLAALSTFLTTARFTF